MSLTISGTSLRPSAFVTTRAVANTTKAGTGPLTAQQIAGMTVAQKKALTAAQIAPLEASALNALDISILNPTQFKAISANALAGVETGQIAKLAKTSIAVMSAQQMGALTSQQLSRLSTDQMSAVTKAALTGLSASSAANLSAAQVGAITSSAITGLSKSAVASLSADKVRALSTASVSALLISTPGALTSTQMSSLTSAQLNGLQTAALQKISLTDLTKSQLGSLSATALAALSATQVSDLLSKNASALSTAQITKLSKAQLANVTTVGMADGTRFNLVWDKQAKAAPDGFAGAVIAAAAEMSSLFTNKVSVNIQVGYGEINGSPLSASAAASSGSYGSFVSYDALRGALTSHSTGDAIESKAFSNLSASDPTSGGRFFLSSAQKKAVGLAGASTTLDGFISLSNKLSFQYTGTATPGKYDAIGAMEHEITEVMGRTGSAGNEYGANTYTALDLYRYSNTGSEPTRAVNASTPGTPYFSIDGGTTNLGTYNAPGNGADLADWSATEIGDPFGYSMAGLAQKITSRDVISMEAIGWHASSAGITLAQAQKAYASV